MGSSLGTTPLGILKLNLQKGSTMSFKKIIFNICLFILLIFFINCNEKKNNQQLNPSTHKTDSSNDSTSSNIQTNKTKKYLFSDVDDEGLNNYKTSKQKDFESLITDYYYIFSKVGLDYNDQMMQFFNQSKEPLFTNFISPENFRLIEDQIYDEKNSWIKKNGAVLSGWLGRIQSISFYEDILSTGTYRYAKLLISSMSIYGDVPIIKHSGDYAKGRSDYMEKGTIYVRILYEGIVNEDSNYFKEVLKLKQYEIIKFDCEFQFRKDGKLRYEFYDDLYKNYVFISNIKLL